MDRITVLGGLLKRIGNFDNRSLETRIIFQKTVYFLQTFGVNLGYNFNYYIYGPYSKDLAHDGYVLEKTFDVTSPVKIADTDLENKFVEFQKFVLPHAGDSRWLEAAASMHIIKTLKPKTTKEELVHLICAKKPYLNDKDFCEAVYNCLLEHKLVSG